MLVTIAENKSFEFIFQDKNGPSMANIRRVSVASRESALVLFPIRPKVLGEITVSVKAESYIGSDAIVRKVLVKVQCRYLVCWCPSVVGAQKFRHHRLFLVFTSELFPMVSLLAA